MTKGWFLLGVAIFSEVIATSALKASEGFSHVWSSLLGIGLIGAAVMVMNAFSKIKGQ